MKKNQIIPVILCGGSGTRLWPLSRESYPKQYLKINHDEPFSFLQKTVKRIKNINFTLDPIIVCNQEHRFIVAEQMRKINIKPSSILLEPEGRNTAPAITSAALKASEKDNDPILLVLPSDHNIVDGINFEKVINSAIDYVNEGKLVAFGVKTYKAATGYGYIESENILCNEHLNGEKIVRFIEKPIKEVAEKLHSNQKFTWNSGIFMFRSSILLQEIRRESEEIYHLCSNALSKSIVDLDFHRLGENFLKCENISIDNALMEKTNLGYVLPLNVGWSDVGDWESMWKISKKDEKGNATFGKVITQDVENSFFRGEERLIVGIGFQDLIVVETNDAILVAQKTQTQNIKTIVQNLKIKGDPTAVKHKKVFRPWGSYISISNGENWQVKELIVNPGQSLSLQMHNHRTEHWIVVSGKACVEKNGEKLELEKNESTYIPLGAKHRLSNHWEETLVIIEVQSGNYLGEDDIVRFDDIYGRKIMND